MIRRPWQVWLWYGLALAIVLPGFAWLTVRVIALDRNERLASAKAEQDELRDLALWRMDSFLMPLIAQEAARPYFVFEPIYHSTGATSPESVVVVSPLLTQPSEYVLLNFELREDGTIVSPQWPDADARAIAIANGVDPGAIGLSRDRLDALETLVEFDDLLERLPSSSLPPWTIAAAVRTGNRPFQTLTNSMIMIGEENAPDQDSQMVSRDFAQRNSTLQQFAQQEVLSQRATPPAWASPHVVQEGIARPLWVGENLLLARRVTIDGETRIQGTWFDWPQLRGALQREVAAEISEVAFHPIRGDRTSNSPTMLAAIPVEISLPAVSVPSGPSLLIRDSLLAAWFGLAAACIAIALLLHSVSALSERRSAFVSAVTHELRTPLTTLQLYSEMLDDELVADDERRRDYIGTMRGEAERLGHLVENVLGYARLERRPSPRHASPVPAGSIMERMRDRVERRARRAGMSVVWTCSDDAADQRVAVEPSVIEQIVFNLVDNACKYAAGGDPPEIHIGVELAGAALRLSVRDFGPGVPAALRRRLFVPFSKTSESAAETAPGVGLGLALSRGLARRAGGDLQFVAPDGAGSQFVLTLPIRARSASE